MRLHYTEHGQRDTNGGEKSGGTIVLLHSNGAMAEDFEISGLVAELETRHHVIVFDRPGYGYSTRPEIQAYDPEAQAALFAHALTRMNIGPAFVAGHNWGTLVALAMALNHPSAVRGLALLSGYYVPTLRLDTWLMGLAALPVIGTLMRHTILPVIFNLLWKPITKKLFAPNDISIRFARFPKWLTLRPSQLLASAEESVMMVPYAKRLSARYEEIRLPVIMVGGENDKLVGMRFQTSHLKDRLRFHPQPTIYNATGHMIHYVHTDEIVHAINDMMSDTPRAANAIHAYAH